MLLSNTAAPTVQGASPAMFVCPKTDGTTITPPLFSVRTKRDVALYTNCTFCHGLHLVGRINKES